MLGPWYLRVLQSMLGSTLDDTRALCHILGAPTLGGVSPRLGSHPSKALLSHECLGQGGLLLGVALTH